MFLLVSVRHLGAHPDELIAQRHNAKSGLSKILFSNPFPKKNAQIANLKNPDFDLIRRIHPECGFYGFMIRFWIRKSGFGFPKKTLPKCAKQKRIGDCNKRFFSFACYKFE